MPSSAILPIVNTPPVGDDFPRQLKRNGGGLFVKRLTLLYTQGSARGERTIIYSRVDYDAEPWWSVALCVSLKRPSCIA